MVPPPMWEPIWTSRLLDAPGQLWLLEAFSGRTSRSLSCSLTVNQSVKERNKDCCELFSNTAKQSTSSTQKQPTKPGNCPTAPYLRAVSELPLLTGALGPCFLAECQALQGCGPQHSIHVDAGSKGQTGKHSQGFGRLRTSVPREKPVGGCVE